MPVLRSKRATQDLAGDVVTPLLQVRVPSGNVTFGAWSYVLRPEGETIRDALILVPNGGDAPDCPDPKMRAKYATNKSYYNDRERNKGFIPLGSRLNPDNVRLIVETLTKNREEAVLYCQDQIAMCGYTISTTGSEKDRAVAYKRKAQFQKRLDTVLQPFNADELVKEMDEIARAQRMSSLDAATRQAVAEMIGSAIDSKFESMINHFSKSAGQESDEELSGARVVNKGRASTGSEFA
jgi:hypothetical protein